MKLKDQAPAHGGVEVGRVAALQILITWWIVQFFSDTAIVPMTQYNDCGPESYLKSPRIFICVQYSLTDSHLTSQLKNPSASTSFFLRSWEKQLWSIGQLVMID